MKERSCEGLIVKIGDQGQDGGVGAVFQDGWIFGVLMGLGLCKVDMPPICLRVVFDSIKVRGVDPQARLVRGARETIRPMIVLEGVG